MEKFDGEKIIAHKSFERLFQRFPQGSCWHHTTRALVLAVVDRIDALLVKDDLPARLVVDRAYIPPEGSANDAKAVRWSLVVMIDDAAIVVPMLLSEKLVQLGETAIFVGDDQGGHRVLEACISEMESARLELAGAWL